jgi:hypothetical protein
MQPTDRVMQVSLYLRSALVARTTLNWNMLWTDRCSTDGPKLWETSSWPFDTNEYEHLCLTIVDVASGMQLCEVVPAESLIDFMEDEAYFSFDSDNLNGNHSEGISMHLRESGMIGIVWENNGEYEDDYDKRAQIAERFIRKRCNA